MLRFAGLCFGMLVHLFRGRRSLLIENLALRQQLVALKRRHPRPGLSLFDKLFWVIARRSGRLGSSLSSSSRRKPSFVGIGLVFLCTGGWSPESGGSLEKSP